MNRRLAAGFVFALTATFCITSILPAFAPTPDSWTTKAPVPYSTGQFSGRVAVLDGKIYAVASPRYLNQSYLAPGYLMVFDPITDTWEEKTPMPVGVFNYALAACQNKLYAISEGATQVYDPATETWTTKATMPTARIGVQANVVDGKIYVVGGAEWPSYFGGFSELTFVQAYEVYDPATDSWSYMPPMPSVVAFYASAVVDDKIYIFGGWHSYNKDYGVIFDSNLIQIYDPKTLIWTQGTPMVVSMDRMGTCATTGLLAPKRIYVIGGVDDRDGYQNTPAPVSRVQVYDTETNSWSLGAEMPTPRWGLSLGNVNDTIYAMGGADSNGNWLTVNEQYIPEGYLSVSTPSPSPSPTATLSTTPSSSPTAASSPAPSLSPTEQPTAEPTLSASPTSDNTLTENFTPVIIIVGLAALAVVLSLLVYFKRRKG